MNASGLAKRYAKALLELASEQGELDRVHKDLETLLATWNESAELQEVFENPSIGAEQRKAVIRAVADKMGLSLTVKNTLLLMSDRQRLRHLPELVAAYQQLAEAKGGRVRAEVVTAAPMPEAYFAQLEKTLEAVTGKKVTIVRKQDESLIAGVVTRVGDKVFDGSLRSRLDELREELLTH